MNPSPLTSAFTRFRDRLRRLAAGIVGNDYEAEDVVHDTFCHLWAKNPAVQTELEALRLGYTAVRNRAIDTIRKRAASAQVDIDTVPDMAADANDAADNPRAVYSAVVSLSRKVLTPRQYEVFRLHDIEGASYDEVADELSTTPENVRMTLCRARKAIREVYRKNNLS